MNENYSKWSKSELIKEIKKLNKRKKYGLIWDEERTKEVFEEEAQKKLPVLQDVSKNGIVDKSKPNNILIEGDNYHALSVLNYTHRGKIDVIYIDPPYNTGAKDWKYNNDYVDKEDGYRHSKWISMMYKRLVLARKLLKENGVMIITIDDNELFSTLGILERMGGEILGIICIVIKPEGRNQDKYIMRAHEYAIFLSWGNPTPRKIKPRMKMKQKYDKMTPDGRKYRWDTFYRRGDKKENPEQESRWYEIYVNEKTLKIETKRKKECVSILPIDTNGSKLIWGSLKPDFDKLIKNLDKNDPEIIAKRTRSGHITIFIRRYEPTETKPLSYWNHPDYSPQAYGAKLVRNILENKAEFDYPKSIFAVYDCLDIFLPENGTVLDFFAGSGTTGHAVLQLNKDDGGNRQFILCTNNENNICTDVCLPRIKKVIKGYTDSKGKKIGGLGGNLKYFRTTFVDSEPTDQNKKKMVEQSTEMLCIKEDCFELVKHGKQFKIFKNNNGCHLGIVYYYDGIDKFKKEVMLLGKKINTYVFSLTDEVNPDNFEDVQKLVTLKPIPSAILNVYKRIFTYVQT